jgi:hypothetical protein
MFVSTKVNEIFDLIKIELPVLIFLNDPTSSRARVTDNEL